MPSVRIDKWLWATWFFKTCALARACELGRIQSEGQQRTLPATGLTVGFGLSTTETG